MSRQPTRTPDQFVVKLADRCNIACTYCYMFEFDRAIAADRPAIMSRAVFDRLVDRLAEHRRREDIGAVSLLLHGGEPLLIGKRRFADYLDRLRAGLGPRGCGVGLQTNGVLLDDEWLDLFVRYGVSFAVSLDGPPAVNDGARVTRTGKGTSAAVVRALRLVERHAARPLFRGVLCVAGPAADGAGVVDYFHRDLGLRQFNFLVPDGNHAQPPRQAAGRGLQAFLCDAFDRWLAIDDPGCAVGLFADAVTAVLAAPADLHLFGRIDGSYAIIETDGTILPHDVLRTCGEAEDRGALNIASDPLARIADPAHYRWLALPDDCAGCLARDTCRGGHPLHRYNGADYNSRSVHCGALFGFLAHVARRVAARLPPGERDRYPGLAALGRAAPPHHRPVAIAA